MSFSFIPSLLLTLLLLLHLLSSYHSHILSLNFLMHYAFNLPFPVNLFPLLSSIISIPPCFNICACSPSSVLLSTSPPLLLSSNTPYSFFFLSLPCHLSSYFISLLLSFLPFLSTPSFYSAFLLLLESFQPFPFLPASWLLIAPGGALSNSRHVSVVQFFPQQHRIGTTSELHTFYSNKQNYTAMKYFSLTNKTLNILCWTTG